MKFRIIAATGAAALALAAGIGCAGGATPDSSTPIVVTSEQEPTKPSGPPVSAEQQNATRDAKSYLAMQGFSRKGLIEQLSSDAGDGYPVKAATAAVDSLHVDWNEQAARTAKSYLKTQAFSRKGLIEQLESDSGDGYTHTQAVYGVTKAGL